jgi:hypothetical protein
MDYFHAPFILLMLVNAGNILVIDGKTFPLRFLVLYEANP